MSKRINFRFVRFFALSVLLLGVQAFAQFEVSPDHFDSPAAKQVHRRAAAKIQAKTQAKSKTASVATAVASQKKTTARKNKTSASQPQTTAALRTK